MDSKIDNNTQRILTMVLAGVDPQAAALQVTGSTEHPTVAAIEKLRRKEGDDYSRVIMFGMLNNPHKPVRINPLDTTIGCVREFLTDIERQVAQERQLTQFLGLSLRGVMDCAEHGRNGLIGMSVFHPEDKELEARANRASKALDRADAALQALDETTLHISDLPDDGLDDAFEIKFDTDEDEDEDE